MANNDDGHSPETCNYNECRANSVFACPFLRNDRADVPADECKHEWRQFWQSGHGGEICWPEGFFCIFCKKIDK